MFRSRLDQIINLKHELVTLAKAVSWSFIETTCGAVYTQGPGMPPLPTRLMAGLAILKHTFDLSDEELCARWVENPYFQFFCGEDGIDRILADAKYRGHNAPLTHRFKVTTSGQKRGMTPAIKCQMRRRAAVGQDVIKVAVIEHHGVNGNIGIGFVHGFGLRAGAIASTVGHDSHNICVMGADDADTVTAVNRLGEIEGGFVVTCNGSVIAELSLPVAGLMSDRSCEDVRQALGPLREAAKSLGTKLAEPFLQVAFLPLPVIPHLKITDKGLVDVDRFELFSP